MNEIKESIMILKIDIIPITEKEPQQQSIFIEGDMFIKTGALVGNLDKIMNDNPSAHLFAPKDVSTDPEGSADRDVGTIHFHIKKADGSTDELVMAHCDAFLMNDAGKTIDRFVCR